MDAQAAPQEDQIVDQIGELMKQLSPEKQAAVLSALAGQMQGEEEQEMPHQTVSPEGGLNGKPVGM